MIQKSLSMHDDVTYDDAYQSFFFSSNALAQIADLGCPTIGCHLNPKGRVIIQKCKLGLK